jgi:hypothetical protein
MTTSALNLHLAAAREADIERNARRRRIDDLAAEPPRRTRRAFAGGRRGRRAAMATRVIG